jgi:hypothetical protein
MAHKMGFKSQNHHPHIDIHFWNKLMNGV